MLKIQYVFQIKSFLICAQGADYFHSLLRE